MEPFPETISGMPLLTINERGEVPQSRLKNASSARAIYMLYRGDDDRSSRNRALQQDLLDGGTPYDVAELEEANQPDTTNLNVGGAKQQLKRAMAPFYRLVRQERLLTVSTLYGADEDKPDYNAILAEEISRTWREGKQTAFQTLRTLKNMIWDGIGVIHWPDDLDWRIRGSGLGQFFFPRQIFANEDEVECPCCVEEYTVTRLWRCIQFPETATANGWDTDAVKMAMHKVTTNIPAYQSWEKLEEELKNNDLGVSTRLPVIRLVNMWVQEFDGTVSHYLFTEEPTDSEDFLYCSRQKYKSMTEAFVIFMNGIGTNTKLHGIRGMGYDIYAEEQQLNRSYSRLIDQGMLASSIMLKPKDENTLNAVAMQYFGNLAMVHPDVDVVPVSMPDLTRSVIPVIETMERLRNERVEGYSSAAVFDGDQRKTKGEIDAHLEQSASLSDAELDLLYEPFERVMQQTVRRMSRRNYLPQDPGGAEIVEMRKRIVKRGVPLEALYMLDVRATKVVRAIGAGSAAAKTIAMQRIGELYPRMDDVAKQTYDRETAIDILGVAHANLYFPQDGGIRTTEQTNIAVLENGQLLDNIEIPIQPSDKDLVHLREHIKPLVEGFQAEQSGQVETAEIGVKMREAFNHASQHLERVSGDPATMEEAAMYRQVLQQVGEVVSNGLKAAQAQEQKAQEEGGDQSQEPGVDPKMIQEVERHRQKMRQDAEAAQLKNQLAVETAQTKVKIADIEAAGRIRRTANQTSK